MTSKTLEIKVPEDLLNLAKNTKPDDIDIEEWILEWTRFGLEVSQKASSRKEALEISENIEKAAGDKFRELVQAVTEQMGTGEGQLFEELGEQVSEYQTRLDDLESLTDLNEKQEGFGKLFTELRNFVDPKHTESAAYKFEEMINTLDNENNLIRSAIRTELAREGGISGTLNQISAQLNIDVMESEMRRKSTLKGDTFEDTMINVLNEQLGSNDLTFTKTKGQIGFAAQGSGNNKKGDIRLDFGPNHVLHGSPIIVEAKSDASFFQNYPANPDKSADIYLQKAMENRKCDVGIWVQDADTAAGGTKWPKNFMVSGDKIFVVWNQEDPSTDWRLLSAVYIAMGRNRTREGTSDDGINKIREVITDLNLEAENFAVMSKTVKTITTRSKDLSGMIAKGSVRLANCIEDVKKTLISLQSDTDDLTDLEFEGDSLAGSEEVGVEDIQKEDQGNE